MPGDENIRKVVREWAVKADNDLTNAIQAL